MANPLGPTVSSTGESGIDPPEVSASGILYSNEQLKLGDAFIGRAVKYPQFGGKQYWACLAQSKPERTFDIGSYLARLVSSIEDVAPRILPLLELDGVELRFELRIQAVVGEGYGGIPIVEAGYLTIPSDSDRSCCEVGSGN